jgi:hypothetical protein
VHSSVTNHNLQATSLLDCCEASKTVLHGGILRVKAEQYLAMRLTGEVLVAANFIQINLVAPNCGALICGEMFGTVSRCII